MKEFGDHFIVVGKVVEEHIRKAEFEPLLHYSGSEYRTSKILEE
jgi:flavin reductase (DIM6/NTAB) family NADH-FMN oxidoreductase RutF